MPKSEILHSADTEYKPGIVNGDIIIKLEHEIESLKKENEEQRQKLRLYEITILPEKDAEYERLRAELNHSHAAIRAYERSSQRLSDIESELLKAKELLKFILEKYLYGWIGGKITNDVDAFLNKIK